jgi:hypothetical protein
VTNRENPTVETEEVEPMNWPDAAVSIALALACAAVAITLILAAFGVIG